MKYEFRQREISDRGETLTRTPPVCQVAAKTRCSTLYENGNLVTPDVGTADEVDLED